MNAITKTDIDVFQKGFAQTIPQIKAVLPAHIPFEKFERVAMLAVQLEPKLLQCEMRSLFIELQKCAADGLLPDRKEAVITFRWNSKKSCNVAVYQPMIAGVKKLARNSGEVASFTAQNVYEGEPFKIILGDDERIEHERKLECIDDDKIIGAYAVVKLKDGTVIREFMSIAEIEKARNTNRDWAKGPWATWKGEMSRKTVGHRIAKSIPRSSDKEGERFYNALDRVTSEAVLEGVPEAADTVPATGGKLAMLESMVGFSAEDDADTGGVVDNAPENAPDEEAARANALVAEVAACETVDAVNSLAKRMEVRSAMSGWKKNRPGLFGLVDEAVRVRLAELEAANG